MKSIGILGGGQLSRLLSWKAKNLPVKLFVLSPSDQDPSAQNNPYWIKGDPHKAKDIRLFLNQLDILSFESEFFSAKSIQKILQSVKSPKPYIAPSLKLLDLIQDRWEQKNLLFKYKINTADFLKINLKSVDSTEQLLKLWKKLGPFVLKTRTGGYDGYGVFVVKKKSQIQKVKSTSRFFIAEKFIPFKRELAILSARNTKGQVVFFPLVESFQKNSICLWVKGPVYHKSLSGLKKQIIEFLNQIDYCGLIAFELFDTGDDLIVNELSPRVHNSGHYSLNALSEDQFTVHLKAIMNWNLKKIQSLEKGFAMMNLLGEGAKNPFFKTEKAEKYYLNEFSKFPFKLKKDIYFWWYGKSVSRKGRKMGHLNSIGKSADTALNKLLKVRSYFKL